jgi:hypothetical protein
MALFALGFLAIAVVSVGLLFLAGILALPAAVLLSVLCVAAVRIAGHSAAAGDWTTRRSRLLMQLGLLTPVVGVGLVVYEIFGPTYGYCEAVPLDPPATGTASGFDAGRCGYRSMLEVQGGVPPVVWAAGEAYLLIGLGALAEAGRLPGLSATQAGRWLMLAATAPVVALGMISWGLAGLLPATILAVVATAAAFAAPPSATRAER